MATTETATRIAVVRNESEIKAMTQSAILTSGKLRTDTAGLYCVNLTRRLRRLMHYLPAHCASFFAFSLV